MIQGSIIGWSNTIGKWTRVVNLTVTGEDVQLKDETFLNGTMVLPHKPLAVSYPNPGSIVMWFPTKMFQNLHMEIQIYINNENLYSSIINYFHSYTFSL